MKKHLVTQDLISSVDWCMKAPSTVVKDQPDPSLTWSKKAFEDLKNKLSRIYGEMPEAARRGIDFEKKVYESANKLKRDKNASLNSGSIHFKSVVGRILEHTFQTKIKKDEIIGQYDCFLYGKIDAYKSNDMVDVKTTANLKPGSYNCDNFQAQLYCYVKMESNFTFLVAEWLDYPKIKMVHEFKVGYDLASLKNIVHNKVIKTFQTLKDLDLWEVYREKYCLY